MLAAPVGVPPILFALARVPPSVSHYAPCSHHVVATTSRGVTAFGIATATGPNSSLCARSPAHPPCSRLDIRLAVAVASRAGGLLHHLLQPSLPPPRPSPLGGRGRNVGGEVLFAVAVVVATLSVAPVLAVSHGNHLYGSREVPRVDRAGAPPHAAEP
jgi:hypothetical protein